MRIGPLRVSRTPPNRFAAMGEALAQLARRGFAPRVVIDAGANVGDWTRLARPLFPSARFHLIEPQRDCLPSLRALPDVTLHAFALSAPGVREVRLVGGGSGAWVAEAGEADGP